MKKMNKKRQIILIKKRIKTLKVSPDLIDLEADADSKISLEENWRIIKPQVVLLGNKIEKTYKGRLSSWELTMEADELDKKRSKNAQRVDDRVRARNTYFPDSMSKSKFKKWANKPNRNDIEGVDTKGDN